MNIDQFIANLQTLQNSINIVAPHPTSVKRSYWGAPSAAISDMPAFINTLSDTERALGMGTRMEGRVRVTVQLLVARATTEDERSSRLATSLWFAAKQAFDNDRTIGGTVLFSTLQGASTTVPVLLQHGGQAYIGFDAYLDAMVITQ